MVAVSAVGVEGGHSWQFCVCDEKFNGLDVWKLSVESKCSISLRIESAGLSVLEK